MRQHVQKAIQHGKIKFESAKKMKIDGHSFPVGTNMVDIKLLKGKAKAKEARTVDPRVQMLVDEYKKARRWRDEQKSRYEQGEISKAGAMHPRITSRILLNKWQRQQEKRLSTLVRRRGIQMSM